VNPRETVSWIIDHFEGGFVSHPHDRGGATKYGITQATLSAARGADVSLEDVRDLSRNEALGIMTTNYVIKPGYLGIDDPRIRTSVIDFAIHSGPRTATKALQRSIGVKDDGIFGPITKQAVGDCPPRALEIAMVAARLSHWAVLLQRDTRQRVFAAGWLHRLAQLLEFGT
jgi:lysozyme family protein